MVNKVRRHYENIIPEMINCVLRDILFMKFYLGVVVKHKHPKVIQ